MTGRSLKVIVCVGSLGVLAFVFLSQTRDEGNIRVSLLLHLDGRTVESTEVKNVRYRAFRSTGEAVQALGLERNNPNAIEMWPTSVVDGKIPLDAPKHGAGFFFGLITVWSQPYHAILLAVELGDGRQLWAACPLANDSQQVICLDIGQGVPGARGKHDSTGTAPPPRQ